MAVFRTPGLAHNRPLSRNLRMHNAFSGLPGGRWRRARAKGERCSGEAERDTRASHDGPRRLIKGRAARWMRGRGVRVGAAEGN